VSFVRMGTDGSRVYIYDDIDRGPTCCFCAFAKVIRQRTDEELAALWLPAGADPEHWRDVREPDFATRDLDAMLAHVAAHRAAGHVVPAWVDGHLREGWTA